MRGRQRDIEWWAGHALLAVQGAASGASDDAAWHGRVRARHDHPASLLDTRQLDQGPGATAQRTTQTQRSTLQTIHLRKLFINWNLCSRGQFARMMAAYDGRAFCVPSQSLQRSSDYQTDLWLNIWPISCLYYSVLVYWSAPFIIPCRFFQKLHCFSIFYRLWWCSQWVVF